MTQPPPQPSSRPAAGLMHGGNVAFTIYADASTRALQVWGPVTAQSYDSNSGAIQSLRVSGARVFDGRLAELVDEAVGIVPPPGVDDESYTAGIRKVLDMIGVMQPVDRAASPAEQPPSSDRFAAPAMDTTRATLAAERDLHLARHAEVMARFDHVAGDIDPATVAGLAKHEAAGQALQMALDVLDGVVPTTGTFRQLVA